MYAVSSSGVRHVVNSQPDVALKMAGRLQHELDQPSVYTAPIVVCSYILCRGGSQRVTGRCDLKYEQPGGSHLAA
jgi:hypothetical protein